MVVFFIFFVGYRSTSLGIVIFPIVFVLTFASAVGQKPVTFASPALRSGWIFVHVVMIFTGYAGLFLSFGASLLYLMQERALKAKSSDGLLSKLPSLQTIDDIGYNSLLFGFPVHDLRPDRRLGAGDREVRPAVLHRSEDSAVVHHVDRVHAAAVHALEFGLAWPSRRAARDLRVCHRAWACGPPTASAGYTGFRPYEPDRHRREPPDRTRGSARAVRHSRGAAARSGEVPGVATRHRRGDDRLHLQPG